MAPAMAGHPLDIRDYHRNAGRFPSIGLEVLNILVHLFGIAITSAMISRKVVWIIKCPTWPRILVLANHTAAWTFFFMVSILVDGLGMELSETVCLLGILTCVFFYTFSKLTIYLFLAEKVFLVWSVSFRSGRRLHCKPYLVSMLLILAYSGVAVMFFMERIARFRGDGLCVIGETRVSSIVHMSYDAFVNVFLTLLFVWPMYTRRLTGELRAVAVRSIWASAFALTGSCINIGVLAVENGRELGWICLACCSTDVMINAATMYWVTTSKCDLTR